VVCDHCVVPITEVVRILATAAASSGQSVGLLYDVDGRMGADEDAVGPPSFWLRVDGTSHGPFETEDQAVEEAECRFGARF
jgi:hypothetical protein